MLVVLGLYVKHAAFLVIVVKWELGYFDQYTESPFAPCAAATAYDQFEMLLTLLGPGASIHRQWWGDTSCVLKLKS